MASIPNSVRVTGFIAPTDSNDTYPVTDPQYQKGGWRQVATLAERDAISLQRRTKGMVVFVVDEKVSYGLFSNDFSNSGWERLPGNPVSYPITNPTLGEFTITHNFGYKPNVTLLDDQGNEIFGEIQHTNNSTKISLNPIPGTNTYPNVTLLIR